MYEKEECDLVCPKCKKHWGSFSFKYDSAVDPKAIKIIAGKKKKFKKGDALACTCCGHEYTNYDVMLNIAETKSNAR